MRLLLLGVFLAYFLGCSWYMLTDLTCPEINPASK